MKGDKIYYQEGFKYQLVKPYFVSTGITGYSGSTEYLKLSKEGFLIILAGYAWDGPSGPTIDTPNSLRGSLVHDALYQLMRLGLLPESCREQADKLLHDLCVEDGMSNFRADLWQAMVEDFAGYAARYGTERPVLMAP
jgi:hypothetical protein